MVTSTKTRGMEAVCLFKPQAAVADCTHLLASKI